MVNDHLGVNDLNEEKLILLTPGPSPKDYLFSMDKNEGIADMFDISFEKWILRFLE